MLNISIIIPNFNGKELLKKNLPKVLLAADYWGGKYEIIVVDDASKDDSVNFLKITYPQIKLITHKSNKKFALSCNNGVSQSKGEIVILLNTDVIPYKNFLKPLLLDFKEKNVFAIGCREEARINGEKVFSGRATGVFKRGFLVHKRAKNQDKKTTLWVATGSAAYRKNIWEKLGGLDLLYKPAYMEDIDISYRAQKAGYKVLFEPQSLVFHQHETTNIKSMGKKGIKLAALKNQFIFVWKNITDIELLISHFIWLPYHLIFDTIKTKGLFALAFFRAITQLPAVLVSRKKARKLFKFSDKEIIKADA